MRVLAQRRYQEFEAQLGPGITRVAVADTIHRFRKGGDLHWPAGVDEQGQVEQIAAALAGEYGWPLATSPALEDVSRLTRHVARRLQADGALQDPVAALSLKESPGQ